MISRCGRPCCADWLVRARDWVGWEAGPDFPDIGCPAVPLKVNAAGRHDIPRQQHRLKAEFVVAARAIGGTHAHVLWRTVLPNALGPAIVVATLGLGTAVVAESGLSFLGFGVPPPAPTWGWTLAYGTRFLRTAPWMPTIVGLAIMITVLGFNLLGDGLRDRLDPRGQTRR
jgi:ABC-type antimicrobial peptide transport system permease subunit